MRSFGHHRVSPLCCFYGENHYNVYFFLQMKVDNLMLNPVSQVIVEIRDNTEQLADKIK